ncbi:glutaminyl-peptide cyclotransferase-like isoform X2 [Ornithodoros turicata]|uniref:glutaminyl-peptide cyclotransferase-like isoform X2 n=1 Tax=Ornithodoros turicata TaxID=34597 RepID=UPI003139443B
MATASAIGRLFSQRHFRSCSAMILLRFLLTAFLSYTNVNAVNWHEFKWPRDIRPVSAESLHGLAKVLDEDREDFNATLDKILIPRVVGTVGSRQVREYIVESMRDLGWDVQEDAFEARTPYGRKRFSNVVATLDPMACRRLVLACHYDSKIHSEGTFLGATDSAVPCAQLIYIAKSLNDKLQKQKQRRDGLTLQLLFFDGEEAFVEWSSTDSLYGSRHLAEKLHTHRIGREQRETLNCTTGNEIVNELDRMEVMVLLDLIGTANPKFYSYFGDTQSLFSRLVQIEQRLNDDGMMETRGRTRYFQDSSKFGFVEDDHIPFLKRGVPIVHLIPNPFPSVWHTLADNRENLHHPTIANLNKVFKVFVAEYLSL